MVTLTLTCLRCGSQNLIRHGKAPNGKQKYRCKDCGQNSRQDPASRAHDPVFRARVLATYHERSSQRGVCRVFGIGRQTLATWLKKSREAAASCNDPGSGTAG